MAIRICVCIFSISSEKPITVLAASRNANPRFQFLSPIRINWRYYVTIFLLNCSPDLGRAIERLWFGNSARILRRGRPKTPETCIPPRGKDTVDNLCRYFIANDDRFASSQTEHHRPPLGFLVLSLPLADVLCCQIDKCTLGRQHPTGLPASCFCCCCC